MKNWIIFSVVFILSLSLVISVFVFWKADEPFSDIEQKAEQFAIDTKALAVVEDSYVYNGNKPYVTVIGVDEYGKEKAIFVPMSLDENSMQEVFLAEGITEDEALERFRNETAVKEILHTKLGFEQPGPVWEITYISKSGSLNYVYLLHENGQWWKRILNL
ncbi:DUF5590 domain-containing protein [Solibacillus sp. MA9]|uniref:DUF5590 domain-containing protein n=1 Tax=Solibacillus palustris TaxID=2908203 RepID=A0ABS9UBE3_9BACL|nr:DUF5590 domain-containing protein [Solibacillus sp. MA9]MCH7321278.1 DUF5590 domain-containing protein [Solibacillus sp. MA9]